MIDDPLFWSPFRSEYIIDFLIAYGIYYSQTGNFPEKEYVDTTIRLEVM